ncbi:nicotinamide/nicotinate riboside kinase [Pelomyxa schiedti]|nr:nicotinamide/nicotinate riboside kinase [Pelomyxa schiedti]
MAASRACFVVGISGPTGSGKTTVVRQLSNMLQWDHTTPAPMVHLDLCFRTGHLPGTEFGCRIKNMETPDAIDYDKFMQQLQKCKELAESPPCHNPESSSPVCSAESSTSGTESGTIQGATKRIVLAEGFLLFCNDTLYRDRLDLRIFLTCDRDTAYTRRLNRKKRKNKELFDAYFDRYVWPGYTEHNAPFASLPPGLHTVNERPVLVIDGTQDPTAVLSQVLDYIRTSS